MANKALFEKLKQDIAKELKCRVWNRWRKQNPDTILALGASNFTNFQMDNIDLDKADLMESDFSGASLNNASLQKADFTYAYLNRANLQQANLVKACLNSASLTLTNLENANLANIDAIEANFRGANLIGVNLENAYMRKAFFKDANLANANLSKATLYNANFQYANLENANLENADLRGVDFSFANLAGVNLKNANLKGAIFIASNLESADLQNAYFHDATIQQSRLCHCNMNGTFFYNTTIEECIDVEGIICEYIELGLQAGKHLLILDTPEIQEEFLAVLQDKDTTMRDVYIKKCRTLQDSYLCLPTIILDNSSYNVIARLDDDPQSLYYEVNKDNQEFILKAFAPQFTMIPEQYWEELLEQYIALGRYASQWYYPGILKNIDLQLWKDRPILLKDKDLVRPIWILEKQEGILLKDFIQNDIDAGTIYNLMIQIVEALHYIHRLATWEKRPPVLEEDASQIREKKPEDYCYHGNIQPCNIIVYQQEEEYITKILEPTNLRWKYIKDYIENTNIENIPNNVLSFVQYLAPEQKTGAEYLTFKADVYSLGMTFFYMLTKQQLTQKIIEENPQYVTQILEKEKVPSELIEIVELSLKKEPTERISTDEILEILEIFYF
ncbi:MAG TPA: pentapeptide repeat-containing protein [Planctomycetota bacterium]|nr:pentapeptide repeat-containing protein [Planctomycetota bacterium]